MLTDFADNLNPVDVETAISRPGGAIEAARPEVGGGVIEAQSIGGCLETAS